MNESEYRDLRGKFVLFEWHIHYLFEGRLVSPRGKRIRDMESGTVITGLWQSCLLYTSPSPRDVEESRMPSSA